MGFNLGGAFPSNFQAPWRNCGSDAKSFYRCKNGMDHLYHHAQYGGAWTSCTALGGEKFNVSCPSCF